MTTEEIRAELNMRRSLRAEVVETLVKFDKSIRDLEKQLAEAEKPKPEEHFVCPNCDLDDFPEVTTECGCRVCKQCAIVCDDCGSIWCANCTFPKGELKLCRPCFDEREAAEEAAEADVAA